MPPDPSPLHGQGWLGAWEVERARRRPCRARLPPCSRANGRGPMKRARPSRSTRTGSASISTCTNRSDEPMPCGLGQHPYFPCTPETRLDTGVESVWTIDEHVLPVEQVPAAGRFDLARPPRLRPGPGPRLRRLERPRRSITDPGLPFRIAMSSPDARFFQLYSPASGGLFVAEPVTHANAALNEPEERMGRARDARAGAGRDDVADDAGGRAAADSPPWKGGAGGGRRAQRDFESKSRLPRRPTPAPPFQGGDQ